MSSLATLALNPSALKTPFNSQLPASPKPKNKGLAQATFGGLGVTFLNNNQAKFGLNQAPQLRPSEPPVDTLEIARGLNYLASELMRARMAESAFAGNQKNVLSSETLPARTKANAKPAAVGSKLSLAV